MRTTSVTSALRRLYVPERVRAAAENANPIGEYIRAQQAVAWGIPAKEWRQ